MPAANRARLLHVLSRLVERQWRASQAPQREVSDE
jgi:hypothetical protein